MQQVRKELEDTRAEKDRLIQEKEKALSQVDRMKTELESAQSAQVPDGVTGEDKEIADNLQRALNIQKKRYEDMQVKYANLESEMESLRSTKGSDDSGEVRDLQSQLAALRVENTHLKELESTRGYFTPLVKELQANNQKFSSENESLRAELAKGKTAVDGAARQIEQFATQNEQLGSELKNVKAEQDEALNQIAGLKSQVQMAAADREKFKNVEEEAQRLSAENRSLQQAYSDLENSTKSQEAKFREIASQFSVLQKNNGELQARDAERTRQIENYRNSLRGNLTDMKNLKSNFESYLESLVASFDDRQK
jgi:chromosome segregation ATPase